MTETIPEILEPETDVESAPLNQESRGRALSPAISRALTPMQMLETAVQKGADIEVLDKLMGLQERYEANKARKAFDAAIARAQIPVVVKKSKVDFKNKSTDGKTNYDYESFAQIAKTVDPVLSPLGLSYRFRTAQEGSQVTVTCIVAHKDGHSEETTLTAAADQSGNKNSVQAIGSTITYLQRYTLKAALGIAAADDDDGAKSDGEPEYISDAQANELVAMADRLGANKQRFCEMIKVESFAAIYASKFAQAKRALDEYGAQK